MTKFANDLARFGEAVRLLGQNQGRVLENYASSLKKQLTLFAPALVEAETLKIAFQEVQDRRQLTQFIDDLVSNVKKIRVVSLRMFLRIIEASMQR